VHKYFQDQDCTCFLWICNLQQLSSFICH